MLADAITPHPFDAANRTARVATLLNGNDAPHDAERAQLRTYLDGAEGDLAKFDEKLELLLKDVNAIREERDALRCDTQDARTILHPIRTLTDDVLHEIFAHCVPLWRDLVKKLIDKSGSDYSSLNSRNAPWTIAHVCSRWRRVALSAPRLWSTIVFTVPRKMGSGKLSSFCYNLGLSMSRSGNIDLLVAMTMGKHTEDIPPMISILLAVSAARWRHLYFRARGEEFPAALSGLYFEHLEKVILFDIEESLDDAEKPLAPFRATPRLTRIRIVGDSEEVCIKLPWSKITHYQGEISKMIMMKGALRAMPNLTHLSLSVGPLHAQVDQRLPKLSFPKLLSLSLDGCTYAFFSALLPHLDIPALIKLRLTFRDDRPVKQLTFGRVRPTTFSLPVTDLFPIQLASLHVACNVSRFRDADVANLMSWLQLATNITALSIHLPSIPDALLRELQGDVLAPRLRCLDLWVIGLEENTQLSASGVLSVLESRSISKPNVSQLEEFCTNVDASKFSEGRLQKWQKICRKVKIFCPR